MTALRRTAERVQVWGNILDSRLSGLGVRLPVWPSFLLHCDLPFLLSFLPSLQPSIIEYLIFCWSFLANRNLSKSIKKSEKVYLT